MNDILKGMLFALMVAYIVSPIDACPGPVDDMLLLLLGLAMRKKS